MRRAVFPCLLLAAALCAGSARAADPSPTPTPAATATPAPGAAHASTEAVKKELTGVIDAQLGAFRVNDYAKAYTFAADEIKGLFDAATFEKMVRSSYPFIAHNAAADYGVSFDTGEEAVVSVRIANADRRSTEYRYMLKKEDGVWKISGVTEIMPAGLSV